MEASIGEVKPKSTEVEAKQNEKFALVYSLKDPAGQLIFKKISEIGVPDWAVPYEFGEDIIHIDASKIKEKKIIFLSRHSSELGTRSLTVHMIGNFGEAKYGGISREVAGTLPKIGANYLRSLSKKCIESGLDKQGFVVSYEATHHGPFTNKACVFIELGSSPAEWKNERGALVIAQTVVESTLTENKDKIVVGLGGGHYCPDFTKLALRQPYSFGHICPKHNLGELNKELLLKMIRHSGASEIILDWKGLKENKPNVLKICELARLPVQRVQNLLK